jgi:pimeloyl-ACP methyl ester carboxylesterase
MNVKKPLRLGLVATGVGAWFMQLAADRRAIHADPRERDLDVPLRGDALAIASSDGTPLHVWQFGSPDAPATVVLVHGWTCAAPIWTAQIRALAGPELRVIAYDLRGHGQSGRPEPPDYSIDAHAADFDAVLRAVLVDGQRAVVAGHSLGGMTIVAWAGRHPDGAAGLIAGAVLVNTGMDGLIAQSPILRAPRRLSKHRDVLLGLVLGSALPLPKGSTPLSSRVVRWVALSSTASPAEVAFCERIVLGCNRDVRALCGNTLSGLDLHRSIASLDVPTVIVGSEDDKLTAPSHVRRLADALPHVVEEIIVPGCGHMSLVTHPDVVTEPIRRLVRDHG